MPSGIYKHIKGVNCGFGPTKGMHWKLSEEIRKRISKRNSNENHPLWKGNDCCYRSLHSWVERKLGKATKCEFCEKIGKGRQIHWANANHKYKRNLIDWISLCISCHGQYDKERGYRRHST